MRRQVLAWAAYDWANSAYATTVMAGFFPVFFKQYWSSGVSSADSTFYLGAANSLASLLIVLLAPVLGAVADSWARRKRFLIFFTYLGVAMTALMPLVAQGEWIWAWLLYVVATVGFSGSVTFYDSLIVFVAERKRLDSVSALGYALGYLGGGLLFAFNVWLTLNPEKMGLADKSDAIRLSFVTVALWWALFAVPLIVWVDETGPRRAVKATDAIIAGLRQLRHTFNEIRRLRVVFIFLCSYWLYIDGVDTIVRMAVDYGLSLGFPAESLIVALLITQFVGFPAAIVFGRLGERFGPKTGLYLAIAVYVGVVIWAARMTRVEEFYVMAVVVGLVQGGIQALSRSVYARLIPADKTAEFFGFYNVLGKFAAVIGPVMVGWTNALTGSARLSLATLLVLFGLGAWLLTKVDIRQGERIAGKL